MLSSLDKEESAMISKQRDFDIEKSVKYQLLSAAKSEMAKESQLRLKVSHVRRKSDRSTPAHLPPKTSIFKQPRTP